MDKCLRDWGYEFSGGTNVETGFTITRQYLKPTNVH